MGDMQSEITMKFFNEGFLINQKAIKNLPEDFDIDNFVSMIESKFKKRPLIINEDIVEMMYNGGGNAQVEINWPGFDDARVVKEKHDDKEAYKAFLNILNYSFNPEDEKVEKLMKSIKTDGVNKANVDGLVGKENCACNMDAPLIVLDAYMDTGQERDVQDFVDYFKARYNRIKDMLCNRQSMNNVTSINRVLNKFDKEGVSIIGIVNDKRTTKNGNIMINMEDLSGSINVLVNKNRKTLHEEAKKSSFG